MTNKKAILATTAAIKGFDKNLACRGFQFEIEKTFTHTGPVRACQGGFHAIIGHPLSVFQYYAPAGSRFCMVELSGDTDSDDNEKTAAEIMKIGREIDLRELTLEAVKWVVDRSHPEGNPAIGTRGAATASGYQGAATASGYQGAATASGDLGAATASGYQGAVSGKDGNALFTLEREPYPSLKIISVAAGIVGIDGIKADTWYVCVGGELVEKPA